MRNLSSTKFESLLIKNFFYIDNLKKIFLIIANLKFYILFFGIIPTIFFQRQMLSDMKDIKFTPAKINLPERNNSKWEKVNIEKNFEKEIYWEKIDDKYIKSFPKKTVIRNNDEGINSLNRSIVFDNSIIGPDTSWLVPPGFKWNNKYKFDASTRGHNRRKKSEEFFAWNGGDAVGQFYYQFLHKKRNSFGLNLGIRSVYSGSAGGGKTAVGEGQSLGFRIDHKISDTEGFAFGAEQLLHFDGLTDTGRDIYMTFSKAKWNKNKKFQFPLDIYTIGVATGKMAEGNVKFLCSNLLGGSGTEIRNQRSLCWAPVFSIARVYNQKLSTFFEYNSKFFLLGTSIIPFNEIPLRGTFAVQLSDHIDNYKLKNFDELKWVFRLSLGF